MSALDDFGAMWERGEVPGQDAPDRMGRFEREWAESEARTAANARPKARPKKAPLTDPGFGGGTLQVATPFGTLDTRIPLPASVERGLAQIGSGIADYGLGGRQLVGAAGREEADNKREVDDMLTKGIIGKINRLVGKAAPAAAMPTQGLLSNVAVGAGMGALEPVGTGESRAVNTGVGAAFGAVPDLMRYGAGRAMRATPADEAMARVLTREGVELAPGDVSRNPWVRAARKLGDESILPGTGGAQLKQRQQEQLNRAAGRAWGSNATSHTPGQRANDRTHITDVMNDVWNRNDLPYDNNLYGELRRMEADAALLPEATARVLQNNIDDLERHVVANPNGDLFIPGQFAFNFQSRLNRIYGGANGTDAEPMRELRRSVINNFNANVRPEDAAALTEARRQYRAFKATEPAFDAAATGRAGRDIGDITPADLSASAVRFNRGNAGETPWGELPAAAQRFLVDRVAQTGGSPKALLQNSALFSVLGSPGFLVSPAAGAASTLAGLTAGAGLTRVLNSPRVLQALAEDPTAYRTALPALALTEGGAREALGNAARLGITDVMRAAPALGGLALTNAFSAPKKSDAEEEERP